MVFANNTNWLYDYGYADDISVPDVNFDSLPSGFSWPPQAFVRSFHSNSSGDLECLKETDSKKRKTKSGICSASKSKACREKLRRDRLNDKFMELGSLLDPGKGPKSDKAAILADAVKIVSQLLSDAQKLKESNSDLEKKIRELKAEKNEQRDEKQRLTEEKERLEQQLKKKNAQIGSPSPPSALNFQGHTAVNKLVPIIGYPGVAMWQFMPPAAVDTSQDHVLHPPVA